MCSRSLEVQHACVVLCFIYSARICQAVLLRRIVFLWACCVRKCLLHRRQVLQPDTRKVVPSKTSASLFSEGYWGPADCVLRHGLQSSIAYVMRSDPRLIRPVQLPLPASYRCLSGLTFHAVEEFSTDEFESVKALAL